MKAPKRCPICGSSSWRKIKTYHAGFSLGKCALGQLLFGREGRWLGLVGNKRMVYACADCHFVMEY